MSRINPHQPRDRYRSALALRIISTILLGSAIVGVSSCSSSRLTMIPSQHPLAGALDQAGVMLVDERGQSDWPQVVLMKDRHPITRGFTRVREQLEMVQRSNRLVVTYLVDHGYRLLGCERSKGRLSLDAKTKGQYEKIKARLEPVSYLDEFSVYQPIRYDLMFAGRLQVHGVEDPELYEQDVALLRVLQATILMRSRRNLDEAERRRLEELDRSTRTSLAVNVDARGKAAAINLLETMAASKAERAILLLGGSHIDSAAKVLRARHVSYVIFEPDGYQGQGPERRETFPPE